MSRALTLAAYVLVVAAAVVYELAGRFGGRSPTLADAVLVLTRRPALRAMVMAGWLWLGWHLFVRGPF